MFNFVTGGIASALDLARSVAGAKDVVVAGGAGAIRQYLKAGLLDELYLHIVPVILGLGSGCFRTSATRRSSRSWWSTLQP